MRITRYISNTLDENDFLDSVAQVAMSVLLMALPFLSMSWISLKTDNYDLKEHVNGFVDFFSNGELGIPIFAVLGSILYIMFRKVGPISNVPSVILAVVICMTLLVDTA